VGLTCRLGVLVALDDRLPIRALVLSTTLSWIGPPHLLCSGGVENSCASGGASSLADARYPTPLPLPRGSLGGVFPSRRSGTCCASSGSGLPLFERVRCGYTSRGGMSVVLFLEPRNVRIQEQELFSDGARLVRTRTAGDGATVPATLPGSLDVRPGRAWLRFRSSFIGKSSSVSMCIAR